VLVEPNLGGELAGPCGINGEILIPQNILYTVHEGETRKRKTRGKMHRPLAGDCCWSWNRLTIHLITDVENDEVRASTEWIPLLSMTG
jgi:hypothetical protein